MIYFYRKFLRIFLVILLHFVFETAYSQNTVTIGSTQTTSDAVLWLVPNGSQGLILPVTQRAGFTPSRIGMIIYDPSDNKVYSWNGSLWVDLTGGGSANTFVLQVNGANLDLLVNGNPVSSLPLSSLQDGVDDADADPTNELISSVVLNSTSIEITDAGGTNSVDLAPIISSGSTDDQNLVLTGDVLSIEGGTGMVDLSSYIDDADNDPANELITGFSLTGAMLDITDAGGVSTVDLTTLQGASDLSGLSDVGDVTSSSAGQILIHNGTNYLNQSVSGDITLLNDGSVSVDAIGGSGLGTPPMVSGQALVYNDVSGQWDAGSVDISTGISPVGSGLRAILGSNNTTNSWVSGNPDQVLTTDAGGSLTFVDKSNFIDRTVQTGILIGDGINITGVPSIAGTIYRGDGTSLVASNIFDDGTNIGIGTNTPAHSLDVNGDINIPLNGSIMINSFSFLKGDPAVNNVFLGNGSGGSITSGTGNLFAGSDAGALNNTGLANVFLGTISGNSNTNGSNNVFVGFESGGINSGGSQNVFIGLRSGNSNVSGSGNTTIGSGADVGVDGLTNATAIGNLAIVNNSNRLVLGTPGTNIQFEGALMPGDIAGNVGEVLVSQGAGVAPIWVPGGGGGWSLTGNGGTNPASNFIGTTDATDFVVRTNNLEALRVYSDGKVGVGTVAPGTEKFTIWDGAMEIGSDIGQDHVIKFRADNVATFWTTGVSDLTGNGDYIISNTNGLSDPILFLGGDSGGFDGNVGIGTTTPASSFTVGLDKFQVDAVEGDMFFEDPLGSITFPNTAGANSPMIQMFNGGTSNANRMVISHSSTFPDWGLQYTDSNDRFNFLSGGINVMTIDLASQLVQLQSGVGINEFSSDATLSGNSNLAVPTEAAVKSYVDGNMGYVEIQSGASTTITSTTNTQILQLNVPATGTFDCHITADIAMEISGNGNSGRYEISIRRGSTTGTQIGQRGWWRPGDSAGFQAITISLSGIDTNQTGPTTYFLVARKFDGTALDALIFLSDINISYHAR